MITQPNLGHAVRALNALAPEAGDVRLGTLIINLITQYNALQADMVALRTKYNALLAHIDTGNVAGIGNTNVANFGQAALTSAAASMLGSL
jgi:hypothetical protein